VKQVVNSWLQTYDTGIQALGPWWNKYLNVNGDYVEVWCVPSVAHVLCISRSQNKVVGVTVPRTLFFEIPLYLLFFFILAICQYL
jgi:hypothetical protein